MSANFVTKPVRDRERGGAEKSDDGRSSSGDGNYWILKFTIFAALAALIYMTLGLVLPLLMAGLFAATLYPFHKKLQSRIKSNGTRAALLTTGFAILFLLPVGAVVFMASNAALKKLKNLPEDWISQIQIEPLIAKVEGYLPFEHDELMKHLQEAGTSIGKTVLSLLQKLLTDLPMLIVVNVVILFGIYVILFHAKTILAWLHRLSPLTHSKTERFFKVVGGLSASSVLATIASGAVQAVILGIVLVVMSMPGAVLITMSAFVLSFVPLIGTAPVFLFLIVSAAIAGDWTRVTVFVITAVVVGVSDNVVRPYVLSDTAKLNAFIGFVAAIGALETMGFYGLFLGPVVAGAVLKLVELVHEERKA